MRRRGGSELVLNEERVLLAAVRLMNEGVQQLYGYELFTLLTAWEGSAPMNHGTLYRCLRSLEKRGMLTATVEQTSPENHRIRAYYRLTGSGITAAQQAAHRLNTAGQPAWVKALLQTKP